MYEVSFRGKPLFGTFASKRKRLRHVPACRAQVVPVCVPELEQVRVAQVLTIAAELAQAYKWALADPKVRRELNLETRVSLAAAARFTATDYLQVPVLAPSALPSGTAH
jgi:hypothetical protein